MTKRDEQEPTAVSGAEGTLRARCLIGWVGKFSQAFQADELACLSAVPGSDFVDQAHVGAELGGLGPDFRCWCRSDWCGCCRDELHGGFSFVGTVKRGSGHRREVSSLDLWDGLVKRTETGCGRPFPILLSLTAPQNRLADFFAQGARYATDATYRKTLHGDGHGARHRNRDVGRINGSLRPRSQSLRPWRRRASRRRPV